MSLFHEDVELPPSGRPLHEKNLPRNIFNTIVMTILIIAAAVTLTLYFKPLYYLDMQRYHLAETFNVTEAEIKANYDALITYNTMFFSGDLKFPTLIMSEPARIHFVEVKRIFLGLQWAGIAALILITPILTRSRHDRDFRWLKYTGFTLIGILVAIAAVFVIGGWDNVFVWFHELAFNNDYWLFNPETDPIINFLPDGFFLHCAIMIVALVLISAFVCMWRYGETRLQFAGKKKSHVELDSDKKKN